MYSKKLILFSILILMVSCSSSIKEKLSEACREADKIVFYNYDTYTGEYSVIEGLKNNEMIINFIRNSVSDAKSDNDKCGFDGKALIYKGEKIIVSLKFNLKEGCRHFAITYGGNVYFREITPKGLSTLKSILNY